MIKKIYLEPTNTCNLNCPLCSTYKGNYSSSGLMDITSFKTVLNKLDPVLKGVERFGLWGRGEPLLNSSVEEMVMEISRKNVFSIINTNGMLLDKGRGKKLIENGLGSIILSIDGISEESYGKYRCGGNLKVVLGNMVEFARQNKKFEQKSGKKTEVIWQFIVMRHNEHEILDLMEFANKYGVNKVVLKKLGHVDDKKVIDGLRDFLPANKSYIRSEYINKKDTISNNSCLNRSNVNKGCSWMDESITVFYNGNVVPCNYDVHERYVYGNLLKDKLSQILKKKKNANKISIPQICNECASRIMGNNLL